MLDDGEILGHFELFDETLLEAVNVARLWRWWEGFGAPLADAW